MSVLRKIVERKRERIAQAKAAVPPGQAGAAARQAPAALDFTAAVHRREGPVRLIAEVKKASPSKGLIRKDFDHKAVAALYKAKAVDAISVLTEEDFFQGRLDYLGDVKSIAALPVLRKDFIVDEYQILEARAHQADAVLLIAAILEDGQAAEYLACAAELGMAALFEVHDHADLDMALRIGAPIIGINNRDLATLRIDLATTFELKKEIPAGRIIVSESGISTRQDVERLEAGGVDAMLVGTSFMASPDIGRKIDELRGAA